MLPRFRLSVIVAFVLILFYLVLLRNESLLGENTQEVDVLNGATGFEHKGSGDDVEGFPTQAEWEAGQKGEKVDGVGSGGGYGHAEVADGRVSSTLVVESSTSTRIAGESPSRTMGAVIPTSSLSLQEEFEAEYAILESNPSTGNIYGNTLNSLIGINSHKGGKYSKTLIPTDSIFPYSEYSPYVYNPYPEYNSQNWKERNQGNYYPCDGPNGPVADILVWEGHGEAFGKPAMGGFEVVGVDGNLYFERETRLGAYGFSENDGVGGEGNVFAVGGRDNGGGVANWGHLQWLCAKRNEDRFAMAVLAEAETGQENGGVVDQQEVGLVNYTVPMNYTAESLSKKRKMRVERSSRTVMKRQDEDLPEPRPLPMIVDEEEDATVTGFEEATDESLKPEAFTGFPNPTPRTAVLIRSYTGQNYTENDKINIRSLIAELCLRTGGEYQVFLLVQVKEETLSARDTLLSHDQILQENIPQEFWDMTILWTSAQMKELYPLIPFEINNAHQSQWLSVQKFSQDHPEYDFIWNWEFDSRYTGQHYNLLSNLSKFAKDQPRKGLWERNERYYIPSFHGTYKQFMTYVEDTTSSVTKIWGPPVLRYIQPVGPTPPMRDNFSWGIGDDADYISLSPIFNPVNTTWPGRDDVWGYGGKEGTPRRASIGTQGRCSRRLLGEMHRENLRGNHVSSEMTAVTVALLNGLKAVVAPVPVWFDRDWSPTSLQKFFNPGPNGQSGGSEESPFSWGRENRFNGSTWYYRASPPMRLYNNWMGWEDWGVGGMEWEKEHGRICLPPMLLHPVKNVQRTSQGWESKSELPYI